MEDLPIGGADYLLIQPVPTGKYAVHGHAIFGTKEMAIGPLVFDAPVKAVNTAMNLAEQNGVSVVYVARRFHA